MIYDLESILVFTLGENYIRIIIITMNGLGAQH